MSIRLPIVTNTTPDSVQSKLSIEDDKNINEYKWKFRNKNNKGIHILVTPFKDKNNIEWTIQIFNVEWNGNDYNESKNPLYSHTESKFNEAISCANNKTKQLLENEYSHIKN